MSQSDAMLSLEFSHKCLSRQRGAYSCMLVRPYLAFIAAWFLQAMLHIARASVQWRKVLGLDHRASRLEKSPSIRQGHINRGLFLPGCKRRSPPPKPAPVPSTTPTYNRRFGTMLRVRGAATRMALLNSRSPLVHDANRSTADGMHRLSVLVFWRRRPSASPFRPLPRPGVPWRPYSLLPVPHSNTASANLLNSPKHWHRRLPYRLMSGSLFPQMETPHGGLR